MEEVRPGYRLIFRPFFTTKNGKRIYARRLGIVEPVFANICVQKRMHRFTVRSKRKVDVQWRLYAMVHNIGKIHTAGALR